MQCAVCHTFIMDRLSRQSTYVFHWTYCKRLRCIVDFILIGVTYPIVPYNELRTLFVLIGRVLDIITMPAQRKVRAEGVHEDIKQFCCVAHSVSFTGRHKTQPYRSAGARPYTLEASSQLHAQHPPHTTARKRAPRAQGASHVAPPTRRPQCRTAGTVSPRHARVARTRSVCVRLRVRSRRGDLLARRA